MKYILMIILLGHGYSTVPVSHSIELDNKAACDTAKKIIIADWKSSGIAYEEKKQITGAKKSDSYEYIERNYSVTCLPAN